MIVADLSGPASEIEAYEPYGGATTFDEVDAFVALQEEQGDIADILGVFQALQQAILGDDDLTPADRAARLVSLAADLQTRLGNPDVGNPYDKDDLGPISTTGTIASKAEGRTWAFWRRLRAGNKAASTPAKLPEAEKADGFDELDATFTLRKDDAGAWRWMIVGSNNLRDSQGEAFSAKSWTDYETRFDRKEANEGRPVELRAWHFPIALGTTEMVNFTNEGFVVAAGSIAPGMEAVAERLAAEKDLGCSHGYRYKLKEYHVDPDRTGVYGWHDTFEWTILPRQRGANKLTFGQLTKEDSMGVTNPTKRNWLVGVFGEKAVATVEGTIHEFAKDAGAKGIAYKDVADAIVDPDGAKADGHTAGCSAPSADSPAFLHSADCLQTTRKQDISPDGSAKKEDAAPDLLAGMKALLDETVRPIADGQVAINARLDQMDGKIAEANKDATDRLADLVMARSRGILPSQSTSLDSLIRGNSREARQAVAGTKDDGAIDSAVDDATGAGAGRKAEHPMDPYMNMLRVGGGN